MTRRLTEGIRFVDEVSIRDAKVLVRVDFNVPIKDGQIQDDRRIRSVLPTINHLLNGGCKVILLSHMGRPKGKRVPNLSLAPVAGHLSKLLGRKVLFVEDCIGDKVKEAVKGPSDVIVLENVRYYIDETENKTEFAEQIKKAVEPDIYVNDAFSASHRKHASVYALPLLFDKDRRYGGILMKNELLALERILVAPQRPFVAIIGGVKVSDKIGPLRNILSLCDKIIIGGAMAFTFLEAMGYKVGRSLVEKDHIAVAKEILSEAAKKNVKVYLPVDCVVAKSPDDVETKVLPIQEIPEDYAGYDIGPATVTLFSEALADAKTVVWNGPMGVFEKEQFSGGTFSLVSVVTDLAAYTVVGGGDTDAAVTKTGKHHKISYISTGGGAFLEALEGRELPGVEALRM